MKGWSRAWEGTSKLGEINGEAQSVVPKNSIFSVGMEVIFREAIVDWLSGMIFSDIKCLLKTLICLK